MRKKYSFKRCMKHNVRKEYMCTFWRYLKLRKNVKQAYSMTKTIMEDCGGRQRAMIDAVQGTRY